MVSHGREHHFILDFDFKYALYNNEKTYFILKMTTINDETPGVSFCGSPLCQSIFARSTLVETPNGYIIERIYVKDDRVICFNFIPEDTKLMQHMRSTYAQIPEGYICKRIHFAPHGRNYIIWDDDITSEKE